MRLSKRMEDVNCSHCEACKHCEAISAFKSANIIVDELSDIYLRTSDLCVAKAKTENFIREWRRMKDRLLSSKFLNEMMNN